MEFFRVGKDHRERLMLAANRIGKTEGVGGYETTLHLTGLYPEWWEGKRFDHHVVAWVSGETGKDVRDSLQLKLLGPFGEFGTGLIPGDSLDKTTPKPGVSEAVDTVYVKHVSGGTSRLTFKSYDQGRESYQAADVDVIWNDEEPPLAVYTESVIRTMTTDGIVMNTFTPLQGMSEVVLTFLPGGKLQ